MVQLHRRTGFPILWRIKYSNILLFVCDFLRAEFVYCYGFRSKEIKAIENIGQSSDLYQSEKTARQMHIHMYTIPTHIGSNVLVGIEQVWNIIKCWTDQTQD